MQNFGLRRETDQLYPWYDYTTGKQVDMPSTIQDIKGMTKNELDELVPRMRGEARAAELLPTGTKAESLRLVADSCGAVNMRITP